MSTTTFTRVAAGAVSADEGNKPAVLKRSQPRAPSDLVIGVCLVHVLRHGNTKQKLVDYLIENSKDFGSFVNLLVPCGGAYLSDIAALAKAVQGHAHLSEMLKHAYENHIGIIYFDSVNKHWETQASGRVARVADDGGWRVFLDKCRKYPELAFVLDVARNMKSPFGDKPYVPPETTVAPLPAPVPAGMH